MVYKLYLLLKLTSCDKWLLSICLFVCLSNWHLGDENNSFRNWINMCLEVKRKWKKIQFILVLLCFLIEKFKNHVRIPKRDTVIQNGSQNEVVVIACYIMVPIATICKESRTCNGSKKRDVAKIYSEELAMKWILKNLPYSK